MKSLTVMLAVSAGMAHARDLRTVSNVPEGSKTVVRGGDHHGKPGMGGAGTGYKGGDRKPGNNGPEPRVRLGHGPMKVVKPGHSSVLIIGKDDKDAKQYDGKPGNGPKDKNGDHKPRIYTGEGPMKGKIIDVDCNERGEPLTKPGNGPKDKNGDHKPGNGPKDKDDKDGEHYDGKPGNGPKDKNGDHKPGNGPKPRIYTGEGPMKGKIIGVECTEKGEPLPMAVKSHGY